MDIFNCIYCYINKINGKRYVGQASNFDKRHRNHINESYNKNIKSYNYPFHKAIRKYGIKNFEVEILKENLETQCLLNLWECYYIDKFNTLAKNQKGYNVASGGSNGNTYAGKTNEEMKEIFNEEWRRKVSDSKKGKNNPMYGISLSGSKNGMYGKTGELNPFYGQHHTEETKKTP